MRALGLCIVLAGCGAESMNQGGREALLAIAQSGEYQSWKAEPEAHRSTGPHGGTVRTFLNDALYESLKSGATDHPPGSIAVKELFTDGKRSGWAVDKKRDDGTWLFFEGFEPQLNQYYFEGTSNLCANCHQSGVDYLLVPASNFP